MSLGDLSYWQVLWVSEKEEDELTCAEWSKWEEWLGRGNEADSCSQDRKMHVEMSNHAVLCALNRRVNDCLLSSQNGNLRWLFLTVVRQVKMLRAFSAFNNNNNNNILLLLLLLQVTERCYMMRYKYKRVKINNYKNIFVISVCSLNCHASGNVVDSQPAAGRRYLGIASRQDRFDGRRQHCCT